MFSLVSGKGPGEDNERNILDINFKLELDGEGNGKSVLHVIRFNHTISLSPT